MAEKNRINAINIIRSNGGKIRMSEAISSGISRTMLYTLLEEGIIEKISRGSYRLTELELLSNPDLVTVALRAPNSVICLISALSFHDITTQIPRKVHIAISKKSIAPRIHEPPIQVHWFLEETFQIGVETHVIDNVNVKVYNAEKTIADCFKFRGADRQRCYNRSCKALSCEKWDQYSAPQSHFVLLMRSCSS